MDKIIMIYKGSSFIILMIKLEGIRFQSIKPLFTSYTRKGLRISIQNTARNCKKPGKAINETLVEWDENIYLPILDQHLPFEIYKPHTFGYNPEELDTVLWGNILINLDVAYHAWEVFNKQNQLIGFLSAHIHLLKNIKPEDNGLKEHYRFNLEPKILSIKSIVLYLPFPKSRTVYVEVDVNGSTAKTGKRKSEKGSFVFLDSILLFKSGSVYQGNLNVYEVSSGEQLLGSGKMTLAGDRPQKKVMLMDKKGSVGEAFVEGLLLNVDDKRTGGIEEWELKKERRDTDRGKKIERSSLVRDLHEGKKNKSEYPSFRYKKLSILHKNNSIAFNKQKRFSDQKSSSSNASYLPNKSFDFKSPTCRMKRGTGIGFGYRTDFTKPTKNIPGVGSYYLPSPFDRYE